MIMTVDGLRKTPSGRLRHEIITNTVGLSREDKDKINGLFYRVKQLEDHENIFTKDIRELRHVMKKTYSSLAP